MLRLPFRNQVWRGAAGEFAGSGSGASMDFMDQRAYSPGDDPRHINWQAYARTGSYTMKLFREEIRPIVDLIVDGSPSMFFDPAKEKRTIELIRFLIDSSLAHGAAVNLHLIVGENYLPIDPQALQSNDWLTKAKATAATKLEAMPAFSKIPLRASALHILVSDLLFSGNPETAFHSLNQQQGRLIIFSPFLESEIRPQWSGNCDFIDVEDEQLHRHRIEEATLKRYRSSYEKHFRLWEQAANRHQSPLARIPCEGDLNEVLHRHALPIKAVETIN